MSITTQITVAATAETIIITAPGALRGPMGDVTPEVTALVERAELGAEQASTSAGQAASSAAQAGDSAAESASSAGSAAGSAAAASEDAIAAEASKTAAGLSESAAEQSATDAAASASAAGRFIMVSATAPTQRTNNTPLQIADEWQDSVNNLRMSWTGSAWVALNSSAQGLEARLSAPTGTEVVHHMSRDLSDKLEADLFTPGDLGAVADVAGNIDPYKQFLARRKPALPPVGLAPLPQLNLISETQIGKAHQAFPSAVRYNGYDFILYREGGAHLENLPIANKPRLVAVKRNVKTGLIEDRKIIYQVTETDPRDPNILRDNRGNAILVGGVFKVVIFEWISNYLPGSSRVLVYDLDPANLAAGLVNPVVISGIDAVKSDVRQLTSGEFVFVGYTAANICYLTRTANWADFTLELIGPGNECALAESLDGYLHVIARAEENYGVETTIWYVKPVGSTWRIHDVLPHTLNAPTFIMGATFTQSSAAGGIGSSGWVLLARDKGNRKYLDAAELPTSDLVAFYFKDDSGVSIKRVGQYQVLCPGTIGCGIVSSGDANYCSAIIDPETGNLEIYTYTDLKIRPLNILSTTGTVIFSISGRLTPDGILIKPRRNISAVRNGDFKQGKFGWSSLRTGATFVTSGGNTELKLVDAFGLVQYLLETKAGETIFPSLRMRTESTSRPDFSHFTLEIYRQDISGSYVQIKTMTPSIGSPTLSPYYHRVVGVPFVADGSSHLIILRPATGVVATSYVDEFVLSDSYDQTPSEIKKFAPIIMSKDITLAISAGGGTNLAVAGYSNSIWSGEFGLAKDPVNLPYISDGTDSIILRFDNCLSRAGTVPVIPYATKVNADGSISGSFFSPNAGTIATSVTTKLVVTFVPKDV